MPTQQQDSNGQPKSIGFHHSRLIGRSADELIGICKGVLADGHLAFEEANFLLQWMEANSAYVHRWPFDHLYARIASALQDGKLDDDEERELLTLLSEIALPKLGSEGECAPNELLCDKPVPQIIVADHIFCLTGKFLGGPRKQIETLIVDKGGAVVGNVSRHVNYLLIGSYGSRDWLMSTHGTKIAAAAELKSAGRPISVVAERNFVGQMALQV